MSVYDTKKEIIQKHEEAFANTIGAAVVDKPRVSFWMIFIPILFLYFIYRMQKYKTGRKKFDEDFMITRQRALDLAVEALESGKRPLIDSVVEASGLSDNLRGTYAAWVKALVDGYTDLLTADGDSFAALVRSAYPNRTNFLLTLNHLGRVEKDFYADLKPRLASVAGAVEIITAIETHSRQLRRKLAEQIFP